MLPPIWQTFCFEAFRVIFLVFEKNATTQLWKCTRSIYKFVTGKRLYVILVCQCFDVLTLDIVKTIIIYKGRKESDTTYR